MAVLWGTVKTQIRNILIEEIADWWTSAELLQHGNDIVAVLAAKLPVGLLRPLQETADVTISTSAYTATLPSDTLRPFDFTIADYPTEVVSKVEWDAIYKGEREAPPSTRSAIYYWGTTIYIYPNDTGSSRTGELFYIEDPPDMTNDNSEVPLSKPAVPVIAWAVAAVAKLKEYDFESAQWLMNIANMYAEAIGGPAGLFKLPEVSRIGGHTGMKEMGHAPGIVS